MALPSTAPPYTNENIIGIMKIAIPRDAIKFFLASCVFISMAIFVRMTMTNKLNRCHPNGR
jgi:hypothetical protein